MQELCSICSVRSVRTFLGLFVCTNVCPAAGTADLCFCRRCQSRFLWCNGGRGRTSCIEHPRTGWEGCHLVRRLRGRLGCSRRLRRQISGEVSLPPRVE